MDIHYSVSRNTETISLHFSSEGIGFIRVDNLCDIEQELKPHYYRGFNHFHCPWKEWNMTLGFGLRTYHLFKYFLLPSSMFLYGIFTIPWDNSSNEPQIIVENLSLGEVMECKSGQIKITTKINTCGHTSLPGLWGFPSSSSFTMPLNLACFLACRCSCGINTSSLIFCWCTFMAGYLISTFRISPEQHLKLGETCIWYLLVLF